MPDASDNIDLIIIGAGLTGLTLAYRLRDSGLRVCILEARLRIGGRIRTTASTEFLPPQEMGATWFGNKHTSLVALLKELNVGRFPQKMDGRALYQPSVHEVVQLIRLPVESDPSFRIAHGTSALIDTLYVSLPETSTLLNSTVKALTDKGDSIEVEVLRDGNLIRLSAKQVVSTLPPNLFLKTLHLKGSLPDGLLSACAKTHTWMGESIKLSVAYRDPFWRKPNTSGTIFSNAGPITEFYDHCPIEDDSYALMGFVNGDLSTLSKDDRKQLVIAQLVQLYGPQAADVLTYNEVVWRDEAFTYAPYTYGLVPHQNNGHPIFRQGFWKNKLFIGGSETATLHPGYMEGAVASANWLAQQFTRT